MSHIKDRTLAERVFYALFALIFLGGLYSAYDKGGLDVYKNSDRLLTFTDHPVQYCLEIAMATGGTVLFGYLSLAPNRKHREGFEQRHAPAPSPKGAAHLLLLPFVFAIAGGVTCGLVLGLCAIARFFKPAMVGFSAHSEIGKTLIVLSSMFASFPAGLMATNVLVWLIVPLRHYFELEAAGRKGNAFKESMLGLLKFSEYYLPACLALGLVGALAF